jgi:hypothetical protein
VNPRLLRVVLGFLAGFVLISLIPALPELVKTAPNLPSPDQVGDALLATAAGLCLALLVVVVRRRRRATRRDSGFGRALARQMQGTPARAPARGPGRTVQLAPKPAPARPSTAPASALSVKIRTAARKGERVPALARRHSLSVDAIRAALGDPPSTPAARRGSSFRSRQQSVPPVRQARALPMRRNPYGALA